jgi:hypothetical protein
MPRTSLTPGSLVEIPTAHGRGWFRALVLSDWFEHNDEHFFTVSALEDDPAGFVDKGEVIDIIDDPDDNRPFRVISA